MSTTEPAPGQQVRSAAQKTSDPLGWALAASPLLPLAITAPLALAGIVAPFSVEQLLALAAGAALVIADKRRLRAGDPALGSKLPATAWFLLPPVYLWKRAAALGTGRGQFWANLGAYAVASALAVTILLGAAGLQMTAAPQLPDCNGREVAADVLRVFEDLPGAKRVGLRGVSLSEQEEAGQGPGRQPTIRYCTGSVLASDTREYNIDYSFELRGVDVIIRLQGQQ